MAPAARALGVPSPAERLAGACARAAGRARARRRCPSGSRCSASTRLPGAHLEVLRRAGRRARRAPAAAASVAGAVGAVAGARVVRRAEDPTARAARQPPARLLGPATRASCSSSSAGRLRRPPPPRRAAPRHAARAPAGRGARGPPPDRARAAADGSVQVHACHGRARQVEVLRDAILHALADDPTLEPRDVIVMCPDIETFAPLIQATFGAAIEADGPDLRVRLADRALRQTNPVLGVVARAARARRRAASPPRRSSTSPTATRCAAASASTTTTSPASRTGWPRPGSAGAWTPSTARRSSSTRRRRHLAGRAGPAAARRDDDRGRAAAVRGRAPARRRREPGDRPRRAGSRSSSTASGPRSTRCAARSRSRAWAAALGDAADALAEPAPRDAWQRAELRRVLDDAVAEAAGVEHRADAAGGAQPARRPPPGPPDAGELPHRAPDRLHARADALGPAPGRLPARPRRRRVPAPGAARRRRPARSRPARRRPRPAQPRTASCCSTRCWPPPTG